MKRETVKRLVTVLLLAAAAFLAVYSFRHAEPLGTGGTPAARTSLAESQLTRDDTGADSATGGEFLNIRLYDLLGVMLILLVGLAAQRALAPRERRQVVELGDAGHPGVSLALLAILAAAIFAVVISVWGVYGNGGGIAGGGLLAAALISYRVLIGRRELDRFFGERTRSTAEMIAVLVVLIVGLIGMIAGAGFLDLAGGGMGTVFREACMLVIALAVTLSTASILYSITCGVLEGWY